MREHYTAGVDDAAWSVFSSRLQKLLSPGTAAPQQLREQLHVTAEGLNRFDSTESCGS